jgi:sigma-E factor negative regulatory protein RseA
MSDPTREELSSLIDEGVDAETLRRGLDGLGGDEALRGAWTRYHLIGYALRGEPVRAEYQQIAPQVAARLQAEPTLLAPPRRRPAQGIRLRPLVGYALAASVALVAVFAMPPLWERPPATGGQLVAQQPAEPSRTLPESPAQWTEGRPALEQKLTRYLVKHQEYAPAGGMKGVLPYATFVSYEGGR